jgi:general secretion pathway protein E
MVTLRDAALHKVVTGDTSLDEAVRKTQTDELEIEMSGVIEKG